MDSSPNAQACFCFMPHSASSTSNYPEASGTSRAVNTWSVQDSSVPEPGGTVLIGQSPVMQKVLSVISRVAPTEFVDINCSAIPETLIEAELFGHQRGAFTGAMANTCGLFEKASGGTIFLDEIDALNLAAQAKLLRVLQERTVRRIGARTNLAIDVRVVSATNCDLTQAVAEGRFRPDLYYRLRVLPIQLPALCMRGDDVKLLIDHFLRTKAERYGVAPRRFTPEAIRTLVEYPWPGNVRELENAIEYALAIGASENLGVQDLPPELGPAHSVDSPTDLKQILAAYMTDSVPLAEIEKRYILSVLQQFGGNQVKAAAALGIDRSKLYRRLKQYGVMAVKFLQEEQDGLQLRTWSASA